LSFELQTVRLHQENEIFSSRLNLLLVGESMLLVSYVSALSLDSSKRWILFILSILGLLITTVFMVIIREHSKYISRLVEKMKNDYPGIDILKENPVGAITRYLSFMVPSIFFSIWLEPISKPQI